MALFGTGNATPTTPKSQFTHRYWGGLGVAHRNPWQTGLPALFGNTGLEVMNRRNFTYLFQDFLINLDCSTVQGGGGEPGAVWEMTGITGATPTFTLTADCPNGLGYLAIGDTTEDHGAHIQFYPNSTTAAGECIDPINQEVVAWAMCGKMPYPLTSDWFVGIAEDGNGTPVLTGATGAINNGHYMGFHHLEDATTVSLVQSGNGTDIVVANPISTPWTPEDGEDPLLLRELGLRIEGNEKLYWYINGVCVGATQVGAAETGGTVEAFADKMTPTLVIVNGDEADSGAAYIDYHTFQTTRLQGPLGG